MRTTKDQGLADDTGLLKIKDKIAGFPSCYDLGYAQNSSCKIFELWENLHPNTGSEKLHIQQDYNYKSCAEEDVVEEGGTV
jgi:hypothetical protein